MSSKHERRLEIERARKRREAARRKYYGYSAPKRMTKADREFGKGCYLAIFEFISTSFQTVFVTL